MPVEILSAEQYKKKIDAMRAQACPIKDSVFDGETGLMYVKGVHPTLIGVETVVALDLTAILMLAAQVIPVAIVPVLQGRVQIVPAVDAKQPS